MLSKKEWEGELLKSLWQKEWLAYVFYKGMLQFYFHVSISCIGPIPMMPSYG